MDVPSHNTCVMKFPPAFLPQFRNNPNIKCQWLPPRQSSYLSYIVSRGHYGLWALFIICTQSTVHGPASVWIFSKSKRSLYILASRNDQKRGPAFVLVAFITHQTKWESTSPWKQKIFGLGWVSYFRSHPKRKLRSSPTLTTCHPPSMNCRWEPLPIEWRYLCFWRCGRWLQ